MKKIELNSRWTLTFIPPGRTAPVTIPARVPGNAYGDLVRAGLLPDPCFGTNSVGTRPLEFIGWEYRTAFERPDTAPGETLRLVFEGIDTIASIRLNGKEIGTADNMFVPHSFDLNPADLNDRNNELSVSIASSVGYARSFPVPPSCFAMPNAYEGLFLRRPMHTWGWDIAPRLVGAGLWRGVHLEILPSERWTGFHLATTYCDTEKAYISLNYNFTSNRRTLEGYSARLTLKCGDSVFVREFALPFTGGNMSFTLERPLLWHPAGSGAANLYDTSLELLRDGITHDTAEWKTGIRTLRLERRDLTDQDADGNFVFIVNGRKTFIKGSNWVPSTPLHGEERGRVSASLKLFSELGCNMIRCWGGGVYEDHEFFDYCDANGILVWQDFMFACEAAPQNDAFLEKVRTEAESVIRKLRNHPSLALWSGDNECD